MEYLESLGARLSDLPFITMLQVACGAALLYVVVPRIIAFFVTFIIQRKLSASNLAKVSIGSISLLTLRNIRVTRNPVHVHLSGATVKTHIFRFVRSRFSTNVITVQLEGLRSWLDLDELDDVMEQQRQEQQQRRQDLDISNGHGSGSMSSTSGRGQSPGARLRLDLLMILARFVKLDCVRFAIDVIRGDSRLSVELSGLDLDSYYNPKSEDMVSEFRVGKIVAQTEHCALDTVIPGDSDGSASEDFVTEDGPYDEKKGLILEFPGLRLEALTPSRQESYLPQNIALAIDSRTTVDLDLCSFTRWVKLMFPPRTSPTPEPRTHKEMLSGLGRTVGGSLDILSNSSMTPKTNRSINLDPDEQVRERLSKILSRYPSTVTVKASGFIARIHCGGDDLSFGVGNLQGKNLVRVGQKQEFIDSDAPLPIYVDTEISIEPIFADCKGVRDIKVARVPSLELKLSLRNNIYDAVSVWVYAKVGEAQLQHAPLVVRYLESIKETVVLCTAAVKKRKTKGIGKDSRVSAAPTKRVTEEHPPTSQQIVLGDVVLEGSIPGFGVALLHEDGSPLGWVTGKSGLVRLDRLINEDLPATPVRPAEVKQSDHSSLLSQPINIEMKSLDIEVAIPEARPMPKNSQLTAFRNAYFGDRVHDTGHSRDGTYQSFYDFKLRIRRFEEKGFKCQETFMAMQGFYMAYSRRIIEGMVAIRRELFSDAAKQSLMRGNKNTPEVISPTSPETVDPYKKVQKKMDMRFENFRFVFYDETSGEAMPAGLFVWDAMSGYYDNEFLDRSHFVEMKGMKMYYIPDLPEGVSLRANNTKSDTKEENGGGSDKSDAEDEEETLADLEEMLSYQAPSKRTRGKSIFRREQSFWGKHKSSKKHFETGAHKRRKSQMGSMMQGVSVPDYQPFVEADSYAFTKTPKAMFAEGCSPIKYNAKEFVWKRLFLKWEADCHLGVKKVIQEYKQWRGFHLSPPGLPPTPPDPPCTTTHIYSPLRADYNYGSEARLTIIAETIRKVQTTPTNDHLWSAHGLQIEINKKKTFTAKKVLFGTLCCCADPESKSREVSARPPCTGACMLLPDSPGIPAMSINCAAVKEAKAPSNLHEILGKQKQLNVFGPRTPKAGGKNFLFDSPISMESPRKAGSVRTVTTVVEMVEPRFMLHHDVKLGVVLGAITDQVACLKEAVAALRKQMNKDAFDDRHPMFTLPEDPPPGSPVDPSITIIRISKGIAEIQDDPLDIFLSVHSQLVTDEAPQALYRQDMLERIIREMDDRISPAKAAGMRRDLLKQNANTFCSRFDFLREHRMRMTHLMVMSLDRVEISLKKERRALCMWTDLMESVKSLDSYKDRLNYPEFSSLKGWDIDVSMENISFKLRDLPFPLLSLGKVVVTGPLFSAAEAVTDDFKFYKRVCLADTKLEYDVEKSLSGSKIFHDVTISITDPLVSFGIAYKPLLRDLLLAVDRLQGDPLLPLPPMALHDKLRGGLHGNLRIELNGFLFRLMASPTLYDAQDYIDVRVHRADIELSAGSFRSTGDGISVVQCSSKQEVCLLYFEGLRMAVKHDWTCEDVDQYNHYSSVWLTTKAGARRPNLKGPRDLEAMVKHMKAFDMFEKYRAQHLDVDVGFEMRCTPSSATPSISITVESMSWILDKLLNAFTAAPLGVKRGGGHKRGTPIKPQARSLGQCLRKLTAGLLIEDLKMAFLEINEETASGLTIIVRSIDSLFALESGMAYDSSTKKMVKKWVMTSGTVAADMIDCYIQTPEAVMKHNETNANGDEDVYTGDFLMSCTLLNLSLQTEDEIRRKRAQSNIAPTQAAMLPISPKRRVSIMPIGLRMPDAKSGGGHMTTPPLVKQKTSGDLVSTRDSSSSLSSPFNVTRSHTADATEKHRRSLPITEKDASWPRKPFGSMSSAGDSSVLNDIFDIPDSQRRVSTGGSIGMAESTGSAFDDATSAQGSPIMTPRGSIDEPKDEDLRSLSDIKSPEASVPADTPCEDLPAAATFMRFKVHDLKVVWNLELRVALTNCVWAFVMALRKTDGIPIPIKKKDKDKDKERELREAMANQDSDGAIPGGTKGKPVVKDTKDSLEDVVKSELEDVFLDGVAQPEESRASVSNIQTQFRMWYIIDFLNPKVVLQTDEPEGSMVIMSESWRFQGHRGPDEGVRDGTTSSSLYRVHFITMDKMQVFCAPTDKDGNPFDYIFADDNKPYIKQMTTPCQMFVSYEQYLNPNYHHFVFRLPSFESEMTSSQFAIMMDVMSNLLLKRLPDSGDESELSLAFDFETADDALPEIMKRREKVKKWKRERLHLISMYVALKAENTETSMHAAGVLSDLEDEIRTKEMKFLKDERSLKQLEAWYKLRKKKEHSDLKIEYKIGGGFLQMQKDDGNPFVELFVEQLEGSIESFEDTSAHATFSITSFSLKSCQPNAVYEDLLGPLGSHEGNFDDDLMVRVIAKRNTPVAGISVYDHFEINISPLVVQITQEMARSIQEFFFPENFTMAVAAALEAEKSRMQKRMSSIELDTTASTISTEQSFSQDGTPKEQPFARKMPVRNLSLNVDAANALQTSQLAFNHPTGVTPTLSSNGDLHRRALNLPEYMQTPERPPPITPASIAPTGSRRKPRHNLPGSEESVHDKKPLATLHESTVAEKPPRPIAKKAVSFEQNPGPGDRTMPTPAEKRVSRKEKHKAANNKRLDLQAEKKKKKVTRKTFVYIRICLPKVLLSFRSKNRGFNRFVINFSTINYQHRTWDWRGFYHQVRRDIIFDVSRSVGNRILLGVRHVFGVKDAKRITYEEDEEGGVKGLDADSFGQRLANKLLDIKEINKLKSKGTELGNRVLNVVNEGLDSIGQDSARLIGRRIDAYRMKGERLLGKNFLKLDPVERGGAQLRLFADPENAHKITPQEHRRSSSRLSDSGASSSARRSIVKQVTATLKRTQSSLNFGGTSSSHGGSHGASSSGYSGATNGTSADSNAWINESWNAKEKGKLFSTSTHTAASPRSSSLPPSNNRHSIN